MNGLEQWTVGCGTLNGQKVYRVAEADAEIARLTAERDALRLTPEQISGLLLVLAHYGDDARVLCLLDLLTDAARTKERIAPVAWEDHDVQLVYELLCSVEPPPDPNEHWEGWVARRIVAALRVAPVALKPLTDEQIRNGWGHTEIMDAIEGPPHRGLQRELKVFTEAIHFAERAHGISAARTKEQP